MQEANADIFDSWIANVVEEWFHPPPPPKTSAPQFDQFGEEWKTPEMIKDYQGKRGAGISLPEITMNDAFYDFKRFAEKSNASRLSEHVTFSSFCSKFAFCRWRKAFDYKPNIVNGKPALCLSETQSQWCAAAVPPMGYGGDRWPNYVILAGWRLYILFIQ